MNELRLQLGDANSQMADANQKASSDVARLLEDERASAEAERQDFLSQIGELYDRSLQQRWDRLKGNCDVVYTDISGSGDLLEESATQYSRHVDQCVAKQEQFAQNLTGSKDNFQDLIEQGRKVQPLGSVSFGLLLNERNRPLVHETYHFDERRIRRSKRYYEPWAINWKMLGSKGIFWAMNWKARGHRATVFTTHNSAASTP